MSRFSERPNDRANSPSPSLSLATFLQSLSSLATYKVHRTPSTIHWCKDRVDFCFSTSCCALIGCDWSSSKLEGRGREKHNESFARRKRIVRMSAIATSFSTWMRKDTSTENFSLIHPQYQLPMPPLLFPSSISIYV